MGSVNPQLLTWARETAGLSLEEGARAVGLKDAYGLQGFERLAGIEAGDQEPPRNLLLKMAKAYRRPLLVFYLNEPPRAGDRGHDFRKAVGAKAPAYNPELDGLIRDIRGRQSLVKSLLEDTESEELSFIGSATTALAADALADSISQRIRFSLAEFRAQSTTALAFGYLRSRIEASGVFVLLLGDLGSHHTKISIEAFRGFAIADPIAPFVVVNDQDARVAWSFTVVHELVHLWLGNTGLSGGGAGARIEQYCNDAAGHLLLPVSELSTLGDLKSAPSKVVVEAISAFADERRISRSMVLYKLFRLSLIGEDTWSELSAYFREQWLESKSKHAEKQKANEGGPSYYTMISC